MRETRNPKWWNKENDSAWERVKAAFKRDWDQTKHDFGGKQPDMNQNVDDTVKQAAGKQPIPPRGQPTFEEYEDAHRFGYGARSYYGLATPRGIPTWRPSWRRIGSGPTRIEIGANTGMRSVAAGITKTKEEFGKPPDKGRH